MTRSPAPLLMLLDTNVWIDFYLGFRPGNADAVKLVTQANAAGAELLYAVTSSKDLFFLLAADFKRDARAEAGGVLTPDAAAAANATAWACLDHMDEFATAVGCDQSDAWFARKQRRLHGDYGDNLVVVAAQRAKADLLVTNDEQLLRHSPVAALDVRDALAWVEAKVG